MLTLGFLTVQKNNKNLLGELFLEKGGLLNLRDTWKARMFCMLILPDLRLFFHSAVLN